MPLLPPGPDAVWPIRILGSVVDWAVVAIGATLTTIVFCNVVMHAVGGDIAWTTELGELLMVWVTFLGTAAAARRGTHMTITEFLDMLKPAGRQIADAAIQLLCLTVLTLLTWYGIGIVRAGWGSVLTVLDWPMGTQYLALPVGAGVTFVFVAYDLVLIVAGRTRDQRYGTT